jgi:hypothetical protein
VIEQVKSIAAVVFQLIALVLGMWWVWIARRIHCELSD